MWRADRPIDDELDEPIKNEKEKAALMRESAWTDMFEIMEHYLDIGLNLLIYGVGSKLAILTRFIEKYLVPNGEMFADVHAYNL